MHLHIWLFNAGSRPVGESVNNLNICTQLLKASVCVCAFASTWFIPDMCFHILCTHPPSMIAAQLALCPTADYENKTGLSRWKKVQLDTLLKCGKQITKTDIKFYKIMGHSHPPNLLHSRTIFAAKSFITFFTFHKGAQRKSNFTLPLQIRIKTPKGSNTTGWGWN